MKARSPKVSSTEGSHVRVSHQKAWMIAAVTSLVTSAGAGCATYSDHMEKPRSYLVQGRAQDAVKELNDTMEVADERHLPETWDGPTALYLLERATALQASDRYKLAARDMVEADQRLDWLDIERATTDELARHIFSDDAGSYRAPAYERLLLNTLNMINFLALNDLQGARVEARRFAIMQGFFEDAETTPLPELVGLGNYLAGATMEASGRLEEALRFYDKSWQSGFRDKASCLRLAALYKITGRPIPGDALERERLAAAINEMPAMDRKTYRERFVDGHVLVFVQTGMAPFKRAERVPIGLALAYTSLPRRRWSATDRAHADHMAAQGLVKWVQFPVLTRQGLPPRRQVQISTDDGPAVAHLAMNVSGQVEAAWERISGHIIVAAITRTIARAIAGAGTSAAAEHFAGGKSSSGSSVLALLAGLAVEGALAIADTPDTRSWTTLPGEIHWSRERMKPGSQRLRVSIDDQTIERVIEVQETGINVVNFSASR
jgi:uncharacterized protein